MKLLAFIHNFSKLSQLFLDETLKYNFFKAQGQKDKKEKMTLMNKIHIFVRNVML